jgi:hypothetical protein
VELVKQIGLKSSEYETLVVDNTAGGVGFTAAKIATSEGKSCQEVVVTVENESIRYTLDGTLPITGAASATSHGHLVTAGNQIIVNHPKDIKNFLAISISGTDAWLRSTFKFM